MQTIANTERKAVLINLLMIALIRIVELGAVRILDTINDSPAKPLNAIENRPVMISAV
jgi:hypothetical protein